MIKLVPLKKRRKQNKKGKMKMNPPLSYVLASAQNDMIKATNDVMKQYGLPACLMDGIIGNLHANIKSQASADLIGDITDRSAEPKEDDNNE